MIEEISEEEWKEVGSPEYLCYLNMYWQDLLDTQSIKGFAYQIDGLGPYRGAVVKIADVHYWLSAYYDPKNPSGRIVDDTQSDEEHSGAYRVRVSIRSYEKDQEYALSVLCNNLEITRDDLWHCNPGLSKAGWQLVRLDDNDNEVEMFQFHSESQAVCVRDAYTKKGHKQDYYVRKL